MHYEVKQQRADQPVFRVVGVKLTRKGWAVSQVVSNLSEKKAHAICAILNTKERDL